MLQKCLTAKHMVFKQYKQIQGCPVSLNDRALTFCGSTNTHHTFPAKTELTDSALVLAVCTQSVWLCQYKVSAGTPEYSCGNHEKINIQADMRNMLPLSCISYKVDKVAKLNTVMKKKRQCKYSSVF